MRKQLAEKIIRLIPYPDRELVDLEDVKFWLTYYACFPAAAAQKLAEKYNLPYDDVFALL